jgi:hypothetical protein
MSFGALALTRKRNPWLSWTATEGPALGALGVGEADTPPAELEVAPLLAAVPVLGVDGEPHPAPINTTKPPREAAKS